MLHYNFCIETEYLWSFFTRVLKQVYTKISEKLCSLTPRGLPICKEKQLIKLSSRRAIPFNQIRAIARHNVTNKGVRGRRKRGVGKKKNTWDRWNEGVPSREMEIHPRRRGTKRRGFLLRKVDAKKFLKGETEWRLDGGAASRGKWASPSRANAKTNERWREVITVTKKKAERNRARFEKSISKLQPRLKKLPAI